MRTISPRFLNKSYFLESSAEYLFSILSVNGINVYLPYGHIFLLFSRNAMQWPSVPGCGRITRYLTSLTRASLVGSKNKNCAFVYVMFPKLYEAGVRKLLSDLCARQRFRSSCTFMQSDSNLQWAHFDSQELYENDTC